MTVKFVIRMIEPLSATSLDINKKLQEIMGAHDGGLDIDFKFENTSDYDDVKLIHFIKEADVIVTGFRPLSVEVLKKCPHLKCIVTSPTGINHLEVEYCRTHNIDIKNGGNYSTKSVAQYTLTFALMSLRHLYPSNDRFETDEGIHSPSAGLELGAHTTVAILGAGNIGVATARLFSHFGCTVLICNRSEIKKDLGFSYQYVPLTREGLKSVYEKANIISLHLPLVPETKSLINVDAFQQMKKNPILINTARGGLIDTEALIHALETNQVSKAALDVIDGELLNQRRALIKSGKLMITPHQAYHTKQAVIRDAKMITANITTWVESTLLEMTQNLQTEQEHSYNSYP